MSNARRYEIKVMAEECWQGMYERAIRDGKTEAQAQEAAQKAYELTLTAYNFQNS